MKCIKASLASLTICNSHRWNASWIFIMHIKTVYIWLFPKMSGMVCAPYETLPSKLSVICLWLWLPYNFLYFHTGEKNIINSYRRYNGSLWGSSGKIGHFGNSLREKASEDLVWLRFWRLVSTGVNRCQLLMPVPLYHIIVIRLSH